MVVHQNITNLAGYFHFLNVRKIPYVIFQDEAAYCLQDTFKLSKAILKCQLDIFEQIGSILTELQEQARQEAEEGGYCEV